MNPAVLETIAEHVKAQLILQKEKIPLSELERQASTARIPHDFSKAFEGVAYGIIAEIKRASPSEGAIFPEADPVVVAREYLSNGARALSILTESRFFDGRLGFLSGVRGVFPEARILMKDFIVDEYQVLQGRVEGADAILLIVALLDDHALEKFQEKAAGHGLSVLVEVHDEEEMRRAVATGAKLIGVNNRNLKTMEVSLKTSERLAKLVPGDVTLISESGLKTAHDLRVLSEMGYRGFLMGTSFMKTRAPGQALAQLMRGLK